MIHGSEAALDEGGEEAHGQDEEPRRARCDHGSGVALDAAADGGRAFFGGDGEASAAENAFGRMAAAGVLLKRGANVAGTDDHGADAIAAQLQALAFREGAERGLGDAIQSHPGQRDFAGNRTHVYDHATTPGAHGGHHQLGQRKGRKKIQLHELSRLFQGDIPGGKILPRAGVINEDVEGAEAIEGAVDEKAAGGFGGQIAGGQKCPRRGGAAEALLGARGERQPGAGAGELGGTGSANALRCSGDEDDLAVNPHAGKSGLALLPVWGKRHNSTMPGLLPLFPLQVVVFPGTALPLHVFEERYKEMVGRAIRENSEFGIVLAREDGIVNAGCTVVVEKLTEMYPDGRMDILMRGRRRFEVLSLNEEKEYLQAEVSYFDDDDLQPVPEELRQQALSHYHDLTELGTARDLGEPDVKAAQLSFQLAAGLPDVNFLSVLLRQRSERGRLKELNEYLAQYIPRQRTIERVKALAPTNGFGGKHVEM